MNLAFNGVMWGLFTRALTLGSSTVRVSVINTSANFMLTAVLGAIIFSEALPGKSFSPRPSPWQSAYSLRSLVARCSSTGCWLCHYWEPGGK